MLNNIKRILKVLYFRFKYRNNNVSISIDSNIIMGTTFEGQNKIHGNTSFGGSLGFGTYIAPHCELSAIIARFTSIGPWVRSNSGIHPISRPYAATSPAFFSPSSKALPYNYATRNMFKEYAKVNGTNAPIIIGNDVWINENVFIQGGVTISDGAVCLAGAVVTKDVPPYAIVGGVPARVLKYRYDEETIRRLMEIKWWDNDPIWFSKNWNLLNNIDELLNYYNDSKTNIQSKGNTQTPV